MRRFVDAQTGVSLIFPDTLALSKLTRKKLQSKVQLTAEARMTVTKDQINSIPNSRPLRLLNPEFHLRGPDDARVISFDFVRNEALAGVFVLTSDEADENKINGLISSDVSYLRPEYKGTSEDFQDNIELASATLTLDNLRSLNAESRVADVVLAIYQLVAAASGKYRKELVGQFMDSANISRDSSTSRWQVCFPTQVPLTQKVIGLQPRSESVYGDATVMALVYGA